MRRSASTISEFPEGEGFRVENLWWLREGLFGTLSPIGGEGRVRGRA